MVITWMKVGPITKQRPNTIHMKGECLVVNLGHGHTLVLFVW